MDDLISRQAVKEWLAKWEGYIDADIIARMQYRIIDIPSAQPEPCEDDPRADVYYLAEKIGIHQLYDLVVKLRGEPEPCEDAVSRQAAIALIRQRLIETALNNLDNSDVYTDIADNRIEAWIDELPSAQPEIIHCRDCVVHGICRFEQGLGLDGFCSQGERKTDGKD